MKLSQLFEKGKFVITSEIGPPKGTNTEGMLKEVQTLKGKVDAVNVTDNQSSVMRMGSLAVSHLLKEMEIEPVFQATCRDRNRLALQSDILSASALGIENLLCVTGDHNTLGDHPSSKPVFDLDSVQLIEAAKKMTQGHDIAGNELYGAPELCIGAVANPGSEPMELQVIKMEQKVEAGAEFFQTQTIYDLDKFEEFAKKAEYLKTPIIFGIVLIKSAGMAKFMNKNISGVYIPEEVIEEIDSVSKPDRAKKSMEIAARMIRRAKDISQGVHIMPLGWEGCVPPLLEEAELI